MGNFLLADWKSMDLQEFLKESAKVILSHEIDEKELFDIKLAVIKLFCDAKNKLMIYKPEAYWINKINFIDNCCFQQVGNVEYINNNYSIIVYIYRLMVYKFINSVEADYLSVIYTGNTWIKNKKFIDEIMSADE